jgi:hypothetical protein
MIGAGDEGRTMTLHKVIGAISAAAFGVLLATSALTQQPLRIFDAHLHYNQEPTPFYELDKVLEIFRRNNITGIIATSRPNKGTHQLVDAKPPGLTVVPFIRPYRTRSDIQTWFDDPAIWELIQPNTSAAIIAASANFTSTARLRPASRSSASSISQSSGIYGCTRTATTKRCC